MNWISVKILQEHRLFENLSNKVFKFRVRIFASQKLCHERIRVFFEEVRRNNFLQKNVSLNFKKTCFFVAFKTCIMFNVSNMVIFNSFKYTKTLLILCFFVDISQVMGMKNEKSEKIFEIFSWAHENEDGMNDTIDSLENLSPEQKKIFVNSPDSSKKEHAILLALENGYSAETIEKLLSLGCLLPVKFEKTFKYYPIKSILLCKNDKFVKKIKNEYYKDSLNELDDGNFVSIKIGENTVEYKQSENNLKYSFKKNILETSFDETINDFKKSNPSITFAHVKIGCLDCLQIDEFPENIKNRNHWDFRSKDGKYSKDLSPIKYIINHYTVCSGSVTLNLFTRNQESGNVSSHFVITEDEKEMKGGIPVLVVPLDKRAWHAGVSSWAGDQSINQYSIGIENVNKGFVEEKIDDKTVRKWFPFDKKQIETNAKLCKDLSEIYSIPPENLLGHADISCGRKSDPGPLFPWYELYKNGAGAWLEKHETDPDYINKNFILQEKIPSDSNSKDSENIAYFSKMLKKYGYDVKETAYITKEIENAILAFKYHFSGNQDPQNCNEKLTTKDINWIAGLVGKYKSQSKK